MRDADAINKIIEHAGRNLVEAVENDLRSIQHSKRRAYQTAFCVSCVNRDGDPIFAACSVCRRGKNGRPTEYRREAET